MKKTLATLALAAAMTQAWGFSFSMPENVSYTARLGYNIGGTMPIGIPATIRSLNSYKMMSNLTLAIDGQKDLAGRWGIMVGLKLEKKGMDVDATVKNYKTAIVQWNNNIPAIVSGHYTGRNAINAETWLVTLPVRATFSVNRNLLLRIGPYVSYALSHNFDGYVYDGYLRVGDPTGEKMDITNGAKATFDFSDDMRRFQFGIDAGVDWNVYRRWGVYAELSWGLTGIFKKNFNTIEETLYPIYGTFGIAYRLK